MTQIRWSTIEIKCPDHHKDEDPFLLKLSTFDGQQNMTEFGEGSSQEWIGDFDGRAVAPTPEGDVQHFRLKMVCPRPSCPYDLPLRLDKLDAVKAQLYLIWRHELPDRVIPNYAKWLDRQP